MHGSIDKPHLSRRRGPHRRSFGLAALIARIALHLRQRRELRELHALDDYQLRDVGLSKYDVKRVCQRWPWKGRIRNYRTWD
jgi:uncharacterized protein YjiS (DUF1127 family)